MSDLAAMVTSEDVSRGSDNVTDFDNIVGSSALLCTSQPRLSDSANTQ